MVASSSTSESTSPQPSASRRLSPSVDSTAIAESWSSVSTSGRRSAVLAGREDSRDVDPVAFGADDQGAVGHALG